MGYQIILRQSDVSTKKARQGARFKLRHPNGDVAYPINDCKDAHDAWDLRNNSDISGQRVAAHVRSAARQIPGCHGPWEHPFSMEQSQVAESAEWQVIHLDAAGKERLVDLVAELRPSRSKGKKGAKPPVENEDCAGCGKETIQTYLSLEKGEVPGVTILQEPAEGETGAMRMRVPFYVGGSVARAKGFKHPILWQEKVLPEMVRRMKSVIQEGKQPLTVYGRHAHAFDATHLPPGAVVDVEQEGRIGYAVLEIEPTTDGKDIQILARGKKLNAVSLRAAPTAPDGTPGYRLELQKVNGKPMLVCEDLLPAGIDFAPEGPAQPTYGVEILNEAVQIEPYQITQEDNHVEITLEELRSEHPTLVQAIEQPLRQELDTLAEKNRKLRDRNKELEKAAQEADKMAYVARVGGSLTQEQQASLREFAASVETKEEIAVQVTELLLQARAQEKREPQLTPIQKLAASLFPGSGSGQQIVQEGDSEGDPDLSVEANLPD